MSQDVETELQAASIHSHTIRADKRSLTLAGPPIPADATLSILLDGRPIWNVRAGDAARPGPGGCVIDWPPALSGRLSGWAQLAVHQGGMPLSPTARIAFDEAPHQFALEEPGTGMPQIVNKWGRIARNFEGQRAYLIDEALDEACLLVEWARSRGLELFVTGGTLLGPVRDGRVMPGDDDVDLAYLSRHENPSDIALEGFELERALHARGYETVRHSAGHLQLLFPGADGTDRFYLDIFTYFNTGGWFHGTFHAREPVDKVTIFPLRSISINGRDLPVPAEPEQMLAAIYGPGWRTPDPAFRFVTPPPARRRYDTWLGGLDWDRENWEDHHRALLRGEGGDHAGHTPSPWAQELARELPPASRILELGCGLGADARHFAGQGHHVVAVDYSRPAIGKLRALQARPGTLEFRRVNLNSLRETAPLAKLVHEGAGPLHVYTRLLLNSLDWQGRENTLELIRQLLKNQGPAAEAFLEVQVGDCGPAFPECRFYGPVDAAELKSSITGLGLQAEDVPQLARQDDGAITTYRVKVRALP
ncbi:bifunctional 2-polyprenyl-6-hydroxyphenol methylase/3-demethylubiquinol 3-O-methyltransferase UbiG [Pseudarthrobacter sp. NamE5]|uniref:class I SAM-dependent methyltransferase n=1 Tax=Pseudarthrobacter sp. NamE5 TaxID=2576839 RepID=UPI00110B59FD|nr:class I SAM-dependent methyltransferase [Pseudarthrobacter sp. NamE5]TLM84699.1 methyltransferase domain-containing protein [Pseudarthrobacter sp. NamE5]